MSAVASFIPSHSSWLDRLSQEKVHIYRSKFDDLSEGLLEYLSPSEKMRAVSSRSFSKTQREFGLGRGWLRHLLSRYSNIPAAELRLIFGEKGKPELFCNPAHLSFNISHSGDEICAIISQNLEVGIDLEELSEKKWSPNLAAEILSENEIREFNTLNEKEKMRSFFYIWTQKEAYLKAIGRGLSIAPNTIEVTVNPLRLPQLIKSLSADEPKEWQMFSLFDLKEFYCIAAVRTSSNQLEAPKVIHWKADSCLD
ncbi:MAG: phosphopantetheine-protein transferase [Bacteriovoracaceae bacterium]|nr:phosphopantetheine-protein transferase [Bacteriovoracaceae bacterium]